VKPGDTEITRIDVKNKAWEKSNCLTNFYNYFSFTPYDGNVSANAVK